MHPVCLVDLAKASSRTQNIYSFYYFSSIIFTNTRFSKPLLFNQLLLVSSQILRFGHLTVSERSKHVIRLACFSFANFFLLGGLYLCLS